MLEATVGSSLPHTAACPLELVLKAAAMAGVSCDHPHPLLARPPPGSLILANASLDTAWGH